MSRTDRELLRELAARIMENDREVAESARALPLSPAMAPAAEGVLEGMPVAEGRSEEIDDLPVMETIVVREGRPVLLISNDNYLVDGPESAIWRDRLNQAAIRQALSGIIPAVGRIEVDNHPTLEWIGTGWLVDDDIVVTNRHVAAEFGTLRGGSFVFRRGWPNLAERMRAKIDFKEEKDTPEPNEFPILDILHIEDDEGPDIAFLKVNRTSATGVPLVGKIRLEVQQATPMQFVATIGYPAADSRVPDQQLVRSIFGDVYNVKRLAPGQLLDPRDDLVLHDCSTLGGNSGSPIIDLQTGYAVGLHYSGLFLRENRGVSAAVVRDRLEKLRSGTLHPVPTIDTAGVPKTTTGQPQVAATGGEQTIRLDVTVPIAVTVRVEAITVGEPPLTGGGAERAPIDTVVEQTRTRFGSLPDVVTVSDGYVFRDGWITDERAVVVAVKSPSARSAADLGIPSQVGGYPVEVRTAGPWDYAESLDLVEVVEGFPRTTYEPPSQVHLSPVKAKMRVVCHLSPDAGWPTLRGFLAATRKRLTIGMYDFTAPQVVDAVLRAVDDKPRALTLVLQREASIGGGIKKFDRPEDETVDSYHAQLGDRFAFQWASVGKNHRFASAYHIKVAVRDGSAFWLSSGNWQSSNQPAEEIPAHDPPWTPLMRYNREWHVVVENKALAGQYEAFLRHDLAQAEIDAALELPAAVPLEFLIDELAVPERVPDGPPTYFAPLDINRVVSVQPLLTPDNYQEHVLKLIESAEEQILFQNQSFSILDDSKNDSRFEALFSALLAKQRAGVDVRIIIRGEFNPERYVEQLKKRGFDTNRIRLQDRCHTKGIIVDRRAVLVGSHNWTNQGTLVNRDASLIFFDEEIAEYFARAFWFDWKKLARASVRPVPVRLADGLETPAGMLRVPWDRLLEI